MMGGVYLTDGSLWDRLEPFLLHFGRLYFYCVDWGWEGVGGVVRNGAACTVHGVQFSKCKIQLGGAYS